MSWIKLDDQFSINDKVLAAGKDGRELHISALCHCGRNLTDGFIDKRMVRQLAAMFEVYDWETAVDALLDVGLWIEVEGGYEIANYLAFNPTREDVEKRRQQRAERQARWRTERRSDDGRFGGDVIDSDDDDDVDATVTHNVTRYETHQSRPLPVPVPVPHPVPVPVVVEAPGADARAQNDDDDHRDPLTARFYGGLQRLGVMVSSQAQAQAYNEVIEDIRGHPQADAFIAQLFEEAAATTSGRITPRWFEVVVDRCTREGRLPGERQQRDGPRNGDARAAPSVDWDAVQTALGVSHE